MIQSGKFDSFMNFKNNIEKIRNFLFERLIEFFGVLLLISGFLILLSLISYNPNDPNFIYPSSQIIENLLGIRGSIVADFLFQSIGLVALFIPITLIFLSISIIFEKKLVGKESFNLEFKKINKFNFRHEQIFLNNQHHKYKYQYDDKYFV